MAERLAEHEATFRFYAELADFLDSRSGDDRSYRFRGNPSVKDAIEAQGVPHPEVAVLLANGEPVDLAYGVQPGDRIAVFPEFRTLGSPATSLIPHPGEPRFVLDVNLGKLARWLRLMGFDALYRNDFADDEVADLSAVESRIALTRDRRLLFRKQIVHGYFVRADDPELQLREVIARYRLEAQVRPLVRCATCNGLITPVEKEAVLHLLEPKTKRYFDTFYQCGACEQVYWNGSHVEGVLARLAQVAPD